MSGPFHGPRAPFYLWLARLLIRLVSWLLVMAVLVVEVRMGLDLLTSIVIVVVGGVLASPVASAVLRVTPALASAPVRDQWRDLR
ncbi:hypothetical protein GCM10010174_88310 [Kutzneria viridogrisea]|uniref:Mg/Co/Ni transporter MgtE n=1 Tax=Kutzneria viridogrisea TaxID=47990 RepID=A0ABR6BZ51_9PSEU|nr:Mg/Co/Ni transporter MgtE [Kutzneria viridogrisea]